jgi:hypothetical protein
MVVRRMDYATPSGFGWLNGMYYYNNATPSGFGLLNRMYYYNNATPSGFHILHGGGLNSLTKNSSTFFGLHFSKLIIHYSLKNIIMNLVNRLASPTPKFFKVVRNISIVLAAVSGAILTAPVAMPAIVVQIATYLAIAGTVAGAISQTAVEGE